MSRLGLCSAVSISVGIAGSLGCCCPARFAPPPVVVQPPPVVINQPPKDQAVANNEAELKKLIAQNLGPNNQAGSLAPNSSFWAKLKKVVAAKQYVTWKAIGPGLDNRPFSDIHPDGGVLIGFFAGTDNGEHVAFLQPIYLTSQGEKVGQAIGRPHQPAQCIKAKPGYAVGGANLRIGLIMDAMTVVFMKVEGERLNLKDQYTSAQVGGMGGAEERFVTNGPLLIGVHGKQNQNDNFSPAGSPNSLGFVLMSQ